MIEDVARQGTEAGGASATPPPGPMAMCPMAKMCEGMMKKPPSGFAAMVAGIMLIVLGALILVEPRILVWLAGAALVLFGMMLLLMSRFIRRLGVQLRGR
ncbi:MAG TPA: hypothetical protein VLC73_00515 [Burkholderiales bacterium]|nr:hypothetical protein [Burkholderiales bacterium]